MVLLLSLLPSCSKKGGADCAAMGISGPLIHAGTGGTPTMKRLRRKRGGSTPTISRPRSGSDPFTRPRQHGQR